MQFTAASMFLGNKKSPCHTELGDFSVSIPALAVDSSSPKYHLRNSHFCIMPAATSWSFCDSSDCWSLILLSSKVILIPASKGSAPIRCRIACTIVLSALFSTTSFFLRFRYRSDCSDIAPVAVFMQPPSKSYQVFPSPHLTDSRFSLAFNSVSLSSKLSSARSRPLRISIAFA